MFRAWGCKVPYRNIRKRNFFRKNKKSFFRVIFFRIWRWNVSQVAPVFTTLTNPLHHVTYLRYLDTAFQSSQFVSQDLFFSSLLDFRILLLGEISGPHSSYEKYPSWLRHLILRTSPGTEYNKPFTGLIVLRHVTTNQAVGHQSWVGKCSPGIPNYSLSI